MVTKRIRMTACMVFAVAIFSVQGIARSEEPFKRSCAIVAPNNQQNALNLLDPISSAIRMSIACHSSSCIASVVFYGSDILRFESKVSSPKELCAFVLQTSDLKLAGSDCVGELKTMRFNISERDKNGNDLQKASIQVQFSSSNTFSPSECIPKESAQFDPGSSGITHRFESSRARVEVTLF